MFRKTGLFHFIKQSFNFWTLASSYGQYKSIKKWESIDGDGKEIPWYTYPTIEYLNTLSFRDKRVLEFGSGNSSIYWSERCFDLVSVEHNQDWFEKVKNRKQQNQRLILKNKDKNYAVLDESGFNNKFDVVIIDGVMRPDCARNVSKLINLDAPDGYMIIQIGTQKHLNI
jgi:hypothetical protein